MNMIPLLFLSCQDLSDAQAHSQKLATEVKDLTQKLQKAKSELKVTTDSLTESQERVESLTQCLRKSESLLEMEKRREGAEANAASNSHSESSHTQRTSPLHQTPKAGKGCDLSMAQDSTTGERELSERVLALEKEVCVSVLCL